MNKFAAFWYVIRAVWHRFWHGKMTSKILYLAFFVVSACCMTMTAVGDHSEGQNDDANSKLSQQNNPSYTYKVLYSVL